MGKIMKQGRVAIILGGRYAGRKGVVVKVFLKFNIYCFVIERLAGAQQDCLFVRPTMRAQPTDHTHTA